MNGHRVSLRQAGLVCRGQRRHGQRLRDQRCRGQRRHGQRRHGQRLRAAGCLVAIVLSLSVAPRSGEARDSRISDDAAKRSSEYSLAKGIPRFAEIEPGLARGGQPSEDGLRFLGERGYRTVISFRKNPGERRILERMGIHYVEIPMRAGLFGAAPPTHEDVNRFLSIVSDSSRRPVFFHYRHGKDRTGAMAAIYRIEASGCTHEQALREMRAFGFSKHYRRLMRYVRAYVPGRAKRERGTFGGCGRVGVQPTNG
jgi:tyrosine-protein phosphatase SIW14